MTLRNSIPNLKQALNACPIHLRSLSSTISPSSSESRLKSSFFKPRLVVFDKDGTLVCFHTMWTPWCYSLAQRMQTVTGIDLSGPLFDVLGFDHPTQKVRIGALAENTHPQIRDKIEDMLHKRNGFSKLEAQKVVSQAWRDTPDELAVKPTGDLRDLFQSLQEEDVRIAICTSDSQEGTFAFLHQERLQDFVDFVVCGDHTFSKPKPNPHNAHYICNKLNVKPSETIMVGDTPADTLMGQHAGLGLSVGVLTGVGDKHDLADADVIVQDVHECVEMILPPQCDTSARRRVHQVTARGLAKIAQHSAGMQFLMQNPGAFAQTSRAFSTSSVKRDREFSHVIVGAGSAGCVLANRLTEERQY